MDDFQLDLNGLNELQQDLKRAIKIYPDKAQENLVILGKQFKSRAIKITRSAVKKHSGKLIKGYKLDPVIGFGINMQVDFRGAAPHFHLIENGHEQITKNGRNVGFVAGRQIVKQCRDEYSAIVPIALAKMTAEILRECDLND